MKFQEKLGQWFIFRRQGQFNGPLVIWSFCFSCRNPLFPATFCSQKKNLFGSVLFIYVFYKFIWSLCTGQSWAKPHDKNTVSKMTILYNFTLMSHGLAPNLIYCDLSIRIHVTQYVTVHGKKTTKTKVSVVNFSIKEMWEGRHIERSQACIFQIHRTFELIAIFYAFELYYSKQPCG